MDPPSGALLCLKVTTSHCPPIKLSRARRLFMLRTQAGFSFKTSNRGTPQQETDPNSGTLVGGLVWEGLIGGERDVVNPPSRASVAVLVMGSISGSTSARKALRASPDQKWNLMDLSWLGNPSPFSSCPFCLRVVPLVASTAPGKASQNVEQLTLAL